MKLEQIHTLMSLIEQAELAETARMWETMFVATSVVSLVILVIIASATKKVEHFCLMSVPISALILLAIIMSNTPTKETYYKEAYVYLVNQRENINTADYKKIEKIIIPELNNKIRN